jgi:hypothetical protein
MSCDAILCLNSLFQIMQKITQNEQEIQVQPVQLLLLLLLLILLLLLWILFYIVLYCLIN